MQGVIKSTAWLILVICLMIFVSCGCDASDHNGEVFHNGNINTAIRLMPVKDGFTDSLGSSLRLGLNVQKTCD